MNGMCACTYNERRKLHNVHYEKCLIYCTLLFGTHQIKTLAYKRMFFKAIQRVFMSVYEEIESHVNT